MDKQSQQRLARKLASNKWGGSPLECFNPDSAIKTWYVGKKRQLNTGPHNYPSKQAKISDGDDVIDMTTLTLTDIDENESDEEVDFQFWMFFRSFIPKILLCWHNFYFILFSLLLYI